VLPSNRITPAEYRSLRASTGCPAACSGDMYSGVPKSEPVRVDPSVSVRSGRSLAMPKSNTLACPPGVTKMLSGLRSR
jgi:hypothetical protein